MIVSKEEWEKIDNIIDKLGLSVIGDDTDIENLYDDFIDDCYPLVNLAGYHYAVSDCLKTIDPTAYRCGLADWIDSQYQEITFPNDRNHSVIYINQDDFDRYVDGNF